MNIYRFTVAAVWGCTLHSSRVWYMQMRWNHNVPAYIADRTQRSLVFFQRCFVLCVLHLWVTWCMNIRRFTIATTWGSTVHSSRVWISKCRNRWVPASIAGRPATRPDVAGVCLRRAQSTVRASFYQCLHQVYFFAQTRFFFARSYGWIKSFILSKIDGRWPCCVVLSLDWLIQPQVGDVKFLLQCPVYVKNPSLSKRTYACGVLARNLSVWQRLSQLPVMHVNLCRTSYKQTMLL